MSIPVTMPANTQDVDQTMAYGGGLPHSEVEELRLLHALSQRLLASQELPTILDEVLKAAMSLGPFDVGVIRLLDSQTQRLEAMASRGYSNPSNLGRPQRNLNTPAGGRITSQVMERRQAWTVENLQQYDGLRSFRAEGMNTAVVVPVRAGEDVIGTLEVGRRDTRKVSADEVRLLETIGSHMGVAVQKVRFFDDTVRAYAKLKHTEESRARLTAIIEATPDFVMMSRADGRVMYMNRAARQLLGVEDGLDLAGEHMLDHRPTWARELAQETIFPALLRGETWTGETAFVDRHDEEVPVHQTSVPHLGADGKPAYFSLIARDIRARKRREMEITEQYRVTEQARSEARAILDAAAEAMVLIAPDSRVLSVNHTFLEFFFPDSGVDPTGHRLDELEVDVGRVFGPSSPVRALLQEAAADPERHFREIIRQEWPEPRELELYSSPVRSADGEYLGRLYSYRDVTREREIDRMKTEFVSLVSHELRTPLTSIKGYVDLLLDGDVGEVTEEQAEFLQTVKSNADRLVGLINDLLDVSRIESGKVELHRAPVDLVRLVRSASEALSPQISEKRQELSLDLDVDVLPVLADADRVIQIVTNLVSNAHKYTPAAGRITVRLRSEPGAVRIEIQDDGIGLAPEEQAQLFTKFFRANNRTTQEVGGTGLGLTITRSLVEMHGGEISVTSAPGEGSTFAFTLPTTTGARPPAPVEPEVGDSPGGGCVLVVDDEPDIANLIRRYLTRAGYRVLVSHTAVDAFQVAREQHPDAITLDVMLPDVDGLTLLEWLKQDSSTRDIPVLLLSVMPDNGHGALLGAVDHLTKPVQERVLIERIGAVLPGSTGCCVLVADDESDVRALIVGHLRRAGHRVVEASNGHEAIDAVHAERPDLALIDAKMPELDGLGALGALRKDPATRDLPVIMMSASPGVLETARSEVEALGGIALMHKPCTPKELADAIAQGLRQRSVA